jgi:predicted TIM-barrel fold metal-dependent hydrolase
MDQSLKSGKAEKISRLNPGLAALKMVVIRSNHSMNSDSRLTRRRFLGTSAAVLLAPRLRGADGEAVLVEPIIDLHQHLNYSGRTDSQFIAHQKALGVTTTVLLPAGSSVDRPSTHQGRSNGLAAQVSGCQAAVEFAKAHPNEYTFFANEVPDLPEAQREIEKFLKLGAIGIGEQKFGVACDSPPMQLIAEIAQNHGVPVLMHFWEGEHNFGIERFHKVLEKFSKVNFIGHAQSWWGNIDRNHDQKVMYPTGSVTPGGITDRLLRDYPNMYGDLSAGSGLNALIRDEDHTRGFLDRHQDKLLFGTDCNDTLGRGPGCQGAQTLAAVRRLASSKAIERKLLHENAKKLLKL